MREKHPIDDLFKKALYHAEAEPPNSVRSGVFQHLDGAAGTRSAGGFWLTAVLLIGLVGAGTAFWAWNAHTTEGTPGPRLALHVNEPGLSSASENANDEQRSNAEAFAGSQDDPAGTSGSTNGTSSRSSTNPLSAAGAIATADEPSTIDVARSTTDRPQGSAMHAATDAFAVATFGTDRTATVSATAIGASGAALIGSNTSQLMALTGSNETQSLRAEIWASPIFDVAFMDPLPIGVESSSGTGLPSAARQLPPYVLPNGVWWVGAYGGVGTVSGSWRGSDVKDLDQAEQWNSTGQAGAIAGREWRSGWGVSAGLGVATVRSRFDFTTSGPLYSVLDVDTSWAEYTHTSSGVPLYSWVIDSVLIDQPGAISRVNARNEYAAVQVPLSLEWHAQVHRMRLGAFGGVMAWIPTKRSGTTLSIPAMDGSSIPVALQGENMDERFAAQLHGQLGLSLGYSITEHFSAYAEPLVSTPILSFGGADTPWLTRPTLQLRIQYELRSRQY